MIQNLVLGGNSGNGTATTSTMNSTNSGGTTVPVTATNTTNSTNSNSNNNNNNTNDYSKKDEFRKYLESNGVMDALTKVLVGLYEEPDRNSINAMDYVKKYLGGSFNTNMVGVDVEGLKNENEQLRKQIEKLQKELLHAQLQQSQQTATTTTNNNIN